MLTPTDKEVGAVAQVLHRVGAWISHGCGSMAPDARTSGQKGTCFRRRNATQASPRKKKQRYLDPCLPTHKTHGKGPLQRRTLPLAPGKPSLSLFCGRRREVEKRLPHIFGLSSPRCLRNAHSQQTAGLYWYGTGPPRLLALPSVPSGCSSCFRLSQALRGGSAHQSGWARRRSFPLDYELGEEEIAG